MKYELRHYAYCISKGGVSIPATRLINELEDFIPYYRGTYSVYNPIAIEYALNNEALTLAIIKEDSDHYFKKEFKLNGFNVNTGTSFHGSDYNNNCSLELTKSQLLQLAAAMDESDVLHIGVADQINLNFFEAQIKKVLKNN